jgi:hypothetical protein
VLCSNKKGPMVLLLLFLFLFLFLFLLSMLLGKTCMFSPVMHKLSPPTPLIFLSLLSFFCIVVHALLPRRLQIASHDVFVEVNQPSRVVVVVAVVVIVVVVAVVVVVVDACFYCCCSCCKITKILLNLLYEQCCCCCCYLLWWHGALGLTAADWCLAKNDNNSSSSNKLGDKGQLGCNKTEKITKILLNLLLKK